MSDLLGHENLRCNGEKQIHVESFLLFVLLSLIQAVPENDGQAYVMRGVCLGRSNKGPRSWFKIYNVFPDAGGFVQHFPL